jgi:hypothetical protein
MVAASRPSLDAEGSAMQNEQVPGAAADGLTIDESAPVISRHSVTVHASAETVWRILTDIDAWTTARQRTGRHPGRSRLEPCSR